MYIYIYIDWIEDPNFKIDINCCFKKIHGISPLFVCIFPVPAPHLALGPQTLRSLAAPHRWRPFWWRPAEVNSAPPRSASTPRGMTRSKFFTLCFMSVFDSWRCLCFIMLYHVISCLLGYMIFHEHQVNCIPKGSINPCLDAPVGRSLP